MAGQLAVRSTTLHRPRAGGRDHQTASPALAYRLRRCARRSWVGDDAGAAASHWPVRTALAWSGRSPVPAAAPLGNTGAPGVADCAEYRVVWLLGITGYAGLWRPRTAPVWCDS